MTALPYRKALAAPLLLIAVLGVAAPAAAAVRWETNLNQARAAAIKANKPMLLEFWSVTCAPCKVMDTEVFSDERVATAMNKLLPVRVDMDKQPETARKYDVDGTPTLIFTDSYGNMLFRYTGLLMVDPVLQLLRELPGDMTRINQLSEKLARDKNDFAALEALGLELRKAGLYRSSNEYLGRAIRNRTARDRADASAGILWATGRNHLELHEFAEAARVFERHLREFPGRPEEPDVMLGLGRAFAEQNKKAEARRILQSLTTRHPAAPAAAAAKKLMASL
jgi:thioredoxin-like negative regulator of GroEL